MPIEIVARPETLGLSSSRLERVGDWTQKQVGRLPGAQVLVYRRGGVAHFSSAGQMDVERGKPVAADTIFRIYSMTKPLTTVAAMMLYERGLFQLDDPISRFVPAFKTSTVYAGGSRGKVETVPAVRGITFRDLMTHTSGLTYGFMESTTVDAIYRAEGIEFNSGKDAPLGEMVERLAAVPLLAQPGTRWNYSVATDVLGYLVEVISGKPLERFLVDEVIKPLAMGDTDFYVPAEKQPRFAANYAPTAEGGLTLIDDPGASRYLAPRQLNSGGGGLVSTTADYARFLMMLRNGGTLDGKRYLGPKTIALMTSNHIGPGSGVVPGPLYIPGAGYGFGLGFAVRTDAGIAPYEGSVGEANWAGVGGTVFWLDPKEDMFVVFMLQAPSKRMPYRPMLRNMIYSAFEP